MLESAPSSRTVAAATIASRVRSLRLLLNTDVAIFLAIVAWLGATAGWRSLALPDEGRYVGVAWEMLRSGQWLVPTLDGLPFFHKPPLFYWLSAASMQVFGAHEWAARLPSLLGASAAAWAIFAFTRRWLGAPGARIVLVVLCTSPGFFGGAQFANHDMLVASWITMAILLAVHAALLGETGAGFRVPLLGAYACAALGVLTKGLIGAALPFLVIGVWSMLERRTRAWRLLFWPPGWLLFAAVASPWFVLVQWRHPGFLHYVFIDQQLRRYVDGGFNNVQPWWFYLPVLAILAMPWIAWLAPAARVGGGAEPTRRSIRRLMAAWVATVLLFFSWPASKLVGYVLPALPPLAFLLAEGVVAGGVLRLRGRAGIPVVVGVAAAACVAGVAGVAAFGARSAAPLARTIPVDVSADGRVLMLGRYVYDAPFYLHLRAPVFLLGAWRDTAAKRTDNAHQEIADAASFAPALARRLLVDPDEVFRVLCEPGTTWIIGDPASPLQLPWLAATVRVADAPPLALWTWDRGDLDARQCRKALGLDPGAGAAAHLGA